MWRLTLPMMAVIALGLGAAAHFDVLSLDKSDKRASAHGGGAETRSAPLRRSEPPVRVTVAEAEAGDTPIYLTAIGTVQAYRTVNVRSRVEGEIKKILFDEGQDVTEGDPLAIIDPRPYQANLRQWEATLRKDRAQVQAAQLDLNRSEELIKRNFVSQQQLDQQRAVVEQGLAQVESDRAQIDYVKLQLEYTTLRSPITGRTGIRQVDEGNIVRAGDNTTVVMIAQLQPISVVFTAPSRAVAQNRLMIGKTNIPVVALAADNITQLDRGTIELVDNTVDQATGTVKLKANFPNIDLKLWPGDFLNGRITVDVRKNGVTVPTAAVRHGPHGDYVWIVRDDETVEPRGIAVAHAANGRTLVARGVRRGELVVIDGHFLLENGRRVDTVASNAGQAVRPQAAAEPP